MNTIEQDRKWYLIHNNNGEWISDDNAVDVSKEEVQRLKVMAMRANKKLSVQHGIEGCLWCYKHEYDEIFKELNMEQTNLSTVEQTHAVLMNAENKVWETIYKRYAEGIIMNKEKYGRNAKAFQPKSPLITYSCIGKVMDNDNTTSYDLRFAGQSVGLVCVNEKWPDKVRLTVNEEQAKYAKEKFHFENSKAFNRIDWKNDAKAIDFRRFYMNNESTKDIAVKSQEHRIESLMLQEFSKTLRKQKKLLCNIQPVKLGGKFFQLKTPLKGSAHDPAISLKTNKNGATGGGIDILARVKHGAFNSRLAVIELKDEKSESQEFAMFQALIYATFIANLLRSESGKKWWYIFKEKKGTKDVLNNIGKIDFSKIDEKLEEVPKDLHIDVVTLMHKEDTKEGSFEDITIKELKVTFHLYSLYYETDEKGNPIRFTGTLKDVLKK